MFWFSLQLSSEIFLILRRNERDTIKKVFWYSCKVPVIIVDFIDTWIFFLQIFVKYSNIKFYENPSRGSRVNPWGRTDVTKLIVAFRNFANAPKKEWSHRVDTSDMIIHCGPSFTPRTSRTLNIIVKSYSRLMFFFNEYGSKASFRNFSQLMV